MPLPKANPSDVLEQIKKESAELGVEPHELISALSEVLGTICLGQEGVDNLRINSGQTKTASAHVKSYEKAQSLAQSVTLEQAELRGVASGERRIEAGLNSAQVLLEAQEASKQQPNLQLVQQAEAQVA